MPFLEDDQSHPAPFATPLPTAIAPLQSNQNLELLNDSIKSIDDETSQESDQTDGDNAALGMRKAHSD